MGVETWFMFKVRINGTQGILYYEERIPRELAPAGYPYMYHLRHDEDDGMEPISIKRFVLVNFLGTIFVNKPFEFGTEPFINIKKIKYERQLIPYKLRKLAMN
jgi:Large polyvalent protein associated domain 28